MSAAGDGLRDPISWLRERAPWLLAPELGACLVGTHALAIACRRADTPAPTPRDLDLAWALDVEAGRQALVDHAVALPSTDGNLERGTLAMKIDGQRIEVTTLRAGDARAPLPERIRSDLAARDMTAGALAVELSSGTLHDPHGGLDDFRARRIVAVGDPAARIAEHPVRWLRYFRKAREWDFELDPRVRKLSLAPATLDASPREAVASELRAALLHCASPGRFFMDLHEVGLLEHLLPELDLQFDGRPAGPQRWHPEVSQALHLILALEWAATRCVDLDERDRLAVMFAVLCHDLGKGYTDPARLPGHPGHERLGLRPMDQLLQRLPGFVDSRARALARAVCDLHVQIRHLDDQRPGTLVRLHDRWLRPRTFPVDLFAMAVAADSAGRLGFAAAGDRVEGTLIEDIEWLRTTCRSVDATALRLAHPGVDEFKEALHEALARAIDESRRARARRRKPSD